MLRKTVNHPRAKLQGVINFVSVECRLIGIVNSETVEVVIRFQSLWAANFENIVTKNCVDKRDINTMTQSLSTS